MRKYKTIHLLGGSSNGWEWRIRMDIGDKPIVSNGEIYQETELTHYRRYRRASDRKWAEKTFSRQFRQKYEIHHEWERGEVMYFLTHEEHKKEEGE